jgi:GWxTD domain-containing protein
MKLNFSILLIVFVFYSFIGCSNIHNYLSSKQPTRTMKEMVESVVKYIATNQEVNTLEYLNTDEELNSFLLDFWIKRDPSPGTDKNEFREEYLERFKIANFAIGGWQSDRGRVFIIYGKPEDIITSPDMEIWIYNKKEKIPFVDNSKSLNSEIESGKIKFYFYDYIGAGVMQQVYSSEFGEGR